VSFLTKLADSSRARDSIVCVGLDPEPDLIPEMLGSGPQAALRFLRRMIRATSDYACAYKPNLAFYERYGSAAFDVLGLTLQAIPDDIPVVLDAKRGDVPNSSAAYADALESAAGFSATLIAQSVEALRGIGIPIGLLALLAYAALVLVGYVSAAVVIGGLLLGRFKAEAVGLGTWRAGAAVLAMLALALLARIPYFGSLLQLAALLVGVGLVIGLFRRREPLPMAPAAAA